MKYKVGDEVMVKAKITSVLGAAYTADCSCGNFYLKNEDILHEPQMTAEEVWGIARRIILPERCGGLSSKEIRHIFGDVDVENIIKNFSPKQVKTKIEAWEAEKEIKVGDVVNVCGDIGVVTSFGTDGDALHVLYFDGIVNSYRRDKDVKKTGRHIDIEMVLKQIGDTDA